MGEDRRLYLVDLSRLYPPEEPKKGIQGAHLFRLLRPEFVKEYEKPLCSDAFSRFIISALSLSLSFSLSPLRAFVLI